MFDLMFDAGLSVTLELLVWVSAAAAACLGVAIALILDSLPAAVVTDDSWRDELPGLRPLKPLLRRFAPMIDARMTSKRRTRLRERLLAAGLGYALVPAELEVLRRLPVIGAVLMVLFLSWRYELWLTDYFFGLLALIPLGWFYVDLWLRDSIKARSDRLGKDFPFFLDVLVLCMRAGLAFPSALHQATLQLPAGPMRHELARLDREVRTGSNRAAALFELAERTKLASVSNFVAVVAQSEETGGSLTNALTEQARQRRRERFARAEKLANQAPVKLLFPLVAFLFPVTFIILGFPLVRDLSGSGMF